MKAGRLNVLTVALFSKDLALRPARPERLCMIKRANRTSMTKRGRSGKSSSTGPTQRQLRAGELIRHALAGILVREDLREPELIGVSVTVSEVRPSPDLRSATVFCAPLGALGRAGASPATPSSRRNASSGVTASTRPSGEIVAALNRCAAFLRGRLGREIALKFTPQLHFVLDESFDEASRIDALLARDDVVRDLTQPDQEASGPRKD